MSRVNMRLARLFEPADAGVYELPSEITAIRKAIDRLHMPTAEVQSVSAVLARLTAETRAAAIAGSEDLPDASAVMVAEREQAVDLHRQRIVADARDQLSESLIATVADQADRIIGEYLRPAHDAAVAALADSAALTAQYESDPRAALTAPAKVRTALAGQPDSYQRYITCIQARSVVLGCGAVPQRDDTQILSGIHNAEDLWPRRARPTAARPWPDGLAGVLWLLRNGAELWLPTAAEQDERYEEVYGEAEREQAAHVSHLRAYGAMFA